MSLGYKLAYRLGVTPWEAAGEGFGPQLDALLGREEAPGVTRGRALDVGCGTGDHAIELATRGWQVTGIDSVPMAVDKARDKAAAAEVNVRWVIGDVASLADNVDTDFRLILDVGCFHGLKDGQRAAYAREVTVIAVPGASLLMFAFGPGRRGPLPRGVSRADVERTLFQLAFVQRRTCRHERNAEAVEEVQPPLVQTRAHLNRRPEPATFRWPGLPARAYNPKQHARANALSADANAPRRRSPYAVALSSS
ncbi:MAG: class I SAM-dependent methyltransferase [Nocardioidaceae bacterium]